MQIMVSEPLRSLPNVPWFWQSRRNAAEDFYRRAEIFILRTMSDGFAITQLEAQAYRLPVIASKFCGKVVENGVNGSILDEPSAACIAHALRDCIASPDRGSVSKLSVGVQTNGTYKGRLSIRKREWEGEGCSQRVVPSGGLKPLTLVLSPWLRGEDKQTRWN
jgi:glycosyltransferase involved in cell wall biosynthesis